MSITTQIISDPFEDALQLNYFPYLRELCHELITTKYKDKLPLIREVPTEYMGRFRGAGTWEMIKDDWPIIAAKTNEWIAHNDFDGAKFKLERDYGGQHQSCHPWLHEWCRRCGQGSPDEISYWTTPRASCLQSAHTLCFWGNYILQKRAEKEAEKRAEKEAEIKRAEEEREKIIQERVKKHFAKIEDMKKWLESERARRQSEKQIDEEVQRRIRLAMGGSTALSHPAPIAEAAVALAGPLVINHATLMKDLIAEAKRLGIPNVGKYRAKLAADDPFSRASLIARIKARRSAHADTDEDPV